MSILKNKNASYNDLIPVELIEKKIGSEVFFRNYGLNHIGAISRMTPHIISEIGLFIWDTLIFKEYYKGDPRALSKYVDKGEALIYQRMEKLIGRKLLFSLLYSKGYITKSPTRKDEPVFEITVAHTFPRTIFLADILFQNLNKPIKQADKKYFDQNYEGFGLLPYVMERLDYVAISKKCDTISLVASRLEQVELFKRFGFRVRDSEQAREALSYGVGICMDKNIG